METGIIDVTTGNLEREHICCAIGNDADNRARAAAKKAWLAGRFPEGHRFKKADVRGKAFIEYGPAESAWFPVEAPGWTFAQCFWVAGSLKGQGLTVYWTPQCPHVPLYVKEMAAAAAELGLPARLVEVDSLAKAKALPSPFGIVSAFLGEELLAWEPMPAGRFKALLEKRRA